ncbi:MAG: hemerythrin domain-containing protein [Candidatus Dormiibacterota bacterium]
MSERTRVTDVIRTDHAWFRAQFDAVRKARDDRDELTRIWAELAARLEVHAAAEETLFYPRLLKDDRDAVDDTEDAIRDHNDIRDGIRDAGEHPIGDDGWWKGVKDTDKANTEHMEEEEAGPLQEFDSVASAREQAELAASFAAFEQEHAGARGISVADKDPERYIEEHLPEPS